MNCFHHPDSPAVAMCPGCDRGVCHPCATRFAPALCESCVVSNNRRVAGRCIVRLAITFLLVAAPLALAVFQDDLGLLPALGVAGVLVAVYWGWTFLSERSPRDSVVVMAPVVLLVFIAVRFIAACAIGLFVAPWGIFKSIRELVTIKRTGHDIRVQAGGVAEAR